MITGISFIFEGIVISKEDDSNNYIVERSDLPGVRSVILRDDIFLEKERKRLKKLDVSR